MTQQEASDKELNPHNYSEGRFKYPINHKDCGRTIYFYKNKPRFGDIPVFEYIQRISLDQPIPESGGGASCPYCDNINLGPGDMTINEAQEAW